MNLFYKTIGQGKGEATFNSIVFGTSVLDVILKLKERKTLLGNYKYKAEVITPIGKVYNISVDYLLEMRPELKSFIKTKE